MGPTPSRPTQSSDRSGPGCAAAGSGPPSRDPAVITVNPGDVVSRLGESLTRLCRRTHDPGPAGGEPSVPPPTRRPSPRTVPNRSRATGEPWQPRTARPNPRPPPLQPSLTSRRVPPRCWAGRGRWLLPTVVTGLLALLLSLLDMGGIVSPQPRPARPAHRHRQRGPGAPLPGQKENLGAQITRGDHHRHLGGDKAEWRELSLASAQDELDSGKLYGALVGTRRLHRLGRRADRHERHRPPALTVLDQPRQGQPRFLARQPDHHPGRRTRPRQTIGEQLTASAKGVNATTKLLLGRPGHGHSAGRPPPRHPQRPGPEHLLLHAAARAGRVPGRQPAGGR